MYNNNNNHQNLVISPQHLSKPKHQFLRVSL